MMKCKHIKVYSLAMIDSLPRKSKWICSVCGEDGISFGMYPDSTNQFEYNALKIKFLKEIVNEF